LVGFANSRRGAHGGGHLHESLWPARRAHAMVAFRRHALLLQPADGKPAAGVAAATAVVAAAAMRSRHGHTFSQVPTGASCEANSFRTRSGVAGAACCLVQHGRRVPCAAAAAAPRWRGRRLGRRHGGAAGTALAAGLIPLRVLRRAALLIGRRLALSIVTTPRDQLRLHCCNHLRCQLSRLSQPCRLVLLNCRRRLRMLLRRGLRTLLQRVGRRRRCGGRSRARRAARIGRRCAGAVLNQFHGLSRLRGSTVLGLGLPEGTGASLGLHGQEVRCRLRHRSAPKLLLVSF
jgi:hypothetical protein